MQGPGELRQQSRALFFRRSLWKKIAFSLFLSFGEAKERKDNVSYEIQGLHFRLSVLALYAAHVVAAPCCAHRPLCKFTYREIASYLAKTRVIKRKATDDSSDEA